MVMNALIQDFIQDGKTFMLVDREGGLQPSDLSKTQTGMMLSSRIRGILQLHLHEVDLKAMLRYDITGKRMLKHCLQSETIGIAEYLGLLLQLVSTMEESHQHMLSLPNYILDEDYMFIEGTLQAGRLYLTYVPCAQMLTEETVQQRISRLASDWVTSVRELSGNYVQRILRYCQTDSFTLQGLKHILLELLAGEQPQPEADSYEASMSVHRARPGDRDWNSLPMVEHPITNQPNITSSSSTEPPLSMLQHLENQRKNQNKALQYKQSSGHTASESIPVTNNKVSEPLNGSLRSRPSLADQGEAQESGGVRSGLSFRNKKNAAIQQAESSPAPATDNINNNSIPVTSAHRTYLLAGGVLVIALLWRYGYMEHSNDMMLYGCTAMTLAVLVLIYMVLKGKLSLSASSAKASDLPNNTADPKWSFFKKKKTMDTQEGDQHHQEAWRWLPNRSVMSSGLNPAVVGSGGNHDNTYPEYQLSPSLQSGNEARSPVDAYSPDMNYAQASIRGNSGYTDSHHSSKSLDDQESPSYTGEAETGILSSHMATVLLGETDHSPLDGISNFKGYLERRDLDGTKIESVRLNTGTFMIGRAEEGVNYCEQSIGTSRNHAELEIRSEQITIKDLSSRNGTLLKGEPLVPYKAYLLQNGDSFTIAKASFTLRIEN